MAFLSGLGKVLGIAGAGVAAPFTGGGSLAALGPILGAGGAALGAISQSKAQNRGAEFTGQMDLEKLLLDRERQAQAFAIAREQEGRAAQRDAYRNLRAAEHLGSPGALPAISPYAVARRAPTEAELTGAEALKREALARLAGGNPIAAQTPRDLAVNPDLLKAGGVEKFAGYLFPALSLLGRLPIQRSPQPVTNGIMSPRVVQGMRF